MELLDPTMCLRIPMIDSLGTVQVDFGHLWILPLGKSQAVQVWTGPRKALVAGQATLPLVRPMRAQALVT